MKFDADAIIAAHANDDVKLQLAKAYASYSSATGRPTKRLVAMALGHNLDTLRRLCAERGIAA